MTHFIKDTILGQNEIITSNELYRSPSGPELTVLMETLTNELRESDNDGFEVIYKVRRSINEEMKKILQRCFSSVKRLTLRICQMFLVVNR